MTERYPTPDKDAIALLEPFERLGLEQIEVVATPARAAQALKDLTGATVLGFDTKPNPTFAKNEASEGPHIVQLSAPDKAWFSQLEDAECRRAVGLVLSSPAV